MNLSFKNFLKATNGILSELSTCEKADEVFHYTGVNSFKSIIESSTLWFKDRFYLNDKSEGVYVLDLFRDNFDNIVSDTPLGTQKDALLNIIEEYKNNIHNKIFKIFQVSFSLNPDNLCMWNYYTKGYGIKGFNIGFDSAKLIQSIKKKWKISENSEIPYILSGKVIYDEEEQIKRIKEFVTRTYSAIYNDLQARNYNDIDKKAVFDFIGRPDIILERITLLGTFFKMPCFKNEEEYRIAVDLYVDEGQTPNTNKSIKYICYENGMIAPYIDLDFDLNSVISIFISPTMDAIETEKNLKCFLAGRHMNNVNIIRSEIPVRF